MTLIIKIDADLIFVSSAGIIKICVIRVLNKFLRPLPSATDDTSYTENGMNHTTSQHKTQGRIPLQD